MKPNQSKVKPSQSKNLKIKKDDPIFTASNYKWMGIGLVFIFVGLLLMIGGKSKDPNVFLENEIYGFRRITLAPFLIVAGFIIEIYAMLKKQETTKVEN